MLKTQKSKVIEFRPRVAPVSTEAAMPLFTSDNEMQDHLENLNLLAIVEAAIAKTNAILQKRLQQGAQVPAGYFFDSIFGLMEVKEEAIAR